MTVICVQQDAKYNKNIPTSDTIVQQPKSNTNLVALEFQHQSSPFVLALASGNLTVAQTVE